MLNTEDYHKFFENVLTRTWLGDNPPVKNLESSLVEKIYISKTAKSCEILLGKSEHFYFLVEYFDQDGFTYSNGLFNNELENLINSYLNRETFLQGSSTQDFIKTILFEKEVRDLLKTNESRPVKRLKI